jgi:hypothetical protein
VSACKFALAAGYKEELQPILAAGVPTWLQERPSCRTASAAAYNTRINKIWTRAEKCCEMYQPKAARLPYSGVCMFKTHAFNTLSQPGVTCTERLQPAVELLLLLSRLRMQPATLLVAPSSCCLSLLVA